MKRPGKRNIFLIGFMASGKTRLGRLLAERLGWMFVDIDREIERAAGASVAEIFARRGELHFRMIEARAIARAARGRKRVIAVGGGAAMNPKNVAAMRKGGAVLYRDTPFATLFERAERKGTAERPLWRGKNEAERKKTMAELHARRRPHYRAAAHATLKTSTGTVKHAADRALRRLLKDGWISP